MFYSFSSTKIAHRNLQFERLLPENRSGEFGCLAGKTKSDLSVVGVICGFAAFASALHDSKSDGDKRRVPGYAVSNRHQMIDANIIHRIQTLTS